jgi:hypothetical protein
VNVCVCAYVRVNFEYVGRTPCEQTVRTRCHARDEDALSVYKYPGLKLTKEGCCVAMLVKLS